MTKIAESHQRDGDDLIIQETHDYTPILDYTQNLRSNGLENFGESKLVANIPMHLWGEWAREAGVKANDPAMSEVLTRKLMDPDFAQFRVWGGNLGKAID